MRGSFSVEYEHPEHPDNLCAADWDFWQNGSWVCSWKSKTGIQWHRESDRGGMLSQSAYEAILAKFGLEGFKDELTMGKVQFMSPAALVRFRVENNLPPIEIFSDTAGDREARAEEYK